MHNLHQASAAFCVAFFGLGLHGFCSFGSIHLHLIAGRGSLECVVKFIVENPARGFRMPYRSLFSERTCGGYYKFFKGGKFFSDKRFAKSCEIRQKTLKEKTS